MEVSMTDDERARAQDMFDRAMEGMAAQDFVQSTGETGCAYRGRSPDGNPVKCVVGQLIPDELYSPTMDQGVQTDVLHKPSVVRAVGLDPKTDFHLVSFLSACQAVHDAAINRVEMISGFRRIAEQTGLVVPKCLL